jgi:Na+(H+)/acetate symporter ActP
MELLITCGAVALFVTIVVWIPQRSYVADRDFTDFAVAGRSFGGFYQAMAFLNTGVRASSPWALPQSSHSWSCI